MGLSSILFQNEGKTAVLLDLPGSIEEAQHPALLPDGCSSSSTAAGNEAMVTETRRRLISSRPSDLPFVTPEPKGTRYDLPSASAQVAELMTQAAVHGALTEVREKYTGPWLLPRVIPSSRCGQDEEVDGDDACADNAGKRRLGKKRKACSGERINVSTTKGSEGSDGEESTLNAFFVPPGSRYIQGSIESTLQEFKDIAPPQFDLIVLDPPWPNRSARRKKDSYSVAASTEEVRKLLAHIPVASRLAPEGLVAVWVTNKPAFREMLACLKTGLFSEWGLELVGEWTWLKVTMKGEPVFQLGSSFRKPWEQLLIAQRRGATKKPPPTCVQKVVIAVPDVHSRKPNLRGLFENILPPGFRGLEVFARNLTAGWWSWGDEVLRFQMHGQWETVGSEGR